MVGFSAPSSCSSLITAVNQYPTEEMKRVLGEKIGLTTNQVNVSVLLECGVDPSWWLAEGSLAGRTGAVRGRRPPD